MYRQPVTGNQSQAISHRQPVTGNQSEATSHKHSQATSHKHRQPVTGNQSQATSHRQKMTRSKKTCSEMDSDRNSCCFFCSDCCLLFKKRVREAGCPGASGHVHSWLFDSGAGPFFEAIFATHVSHKHNMCCQT